MTDSHRPGGEPASLGPNPYLGATRSVSLLRPQRLAAAGPAYSVSVHRVLVCSSESARSFLLCPVSTLRARTNLLSWSRSCPRFTSGDIDKLGYLLMAVVERSNRVAEVQLSPLHKIVYSC